MEKSATLKKIFSSVIVFLFLSLFVLTMSILISNNLNNDIAGAGTIEDPYQIGSFEDFKLIGEQIYQKDYCYILTDDINCTEPISPLNSNWPYNGVFDGDGYTIKNLELDTYHILNENDPIIENPNLLNNKKTFGLFGCIGQNGIVRNLRVEVKSINITSPKIGSNIYWTGGSLDSLNVGAITGVNFGTIEKCSVTGENFNVVARNYTGLFNQYFPKCYVGGLIGLNYGTVTKCFNSATVYAEGADAVGGLIGYTITESSYNSNIDNNYNAGNITNSCKDSIKVNNTGSVEPNDLPSVGGIIGRIFSNNNISLEFMYNKGIISGGYNLGGLIGQYFGDFGNEQALSMEFCYNKGKINGETLAVRGVSQQGNISEYDSLDTNAGGILGKSFRNTGLVNVNNCYNYADINVLFDNDFQEGLYPPRGSSCAGGIMGYSGDDVEISNCGNNGEINCNSVSDNNLESFILGSQYNENLVDINNSIETDCSYYLNFEDYDATTWAQHENINDGDPFFDRFRYWYYVE